MKVLFLPSAVFPILTDFGTGFWGALFFLTLMQSVLTVSVAPNVFTSAYGSVISSPGFGSSGSGFSGPGFSVSVTLSSNGYGTGSSAFPLMSSPFAIASFVSFMRSYPLFMMNVIIILLADAVRTFFGNNHQSV